MKLISFSRLNYICKDQKVNQDYSEKICTNAKNKKMPECRADVCPVWQVLKWDKEY